MNPTETAQALMTAWETCDVAAAARLLADDFTLSGPSPETLGREAYLGFQAVHNEAFPDWRFNPKTLEAKGDTAYITFQITATHTGPYDVAKLGVPIAALAPTGKHRAWPVETMTVTVRDGKVTHVHTNNEPEGGVGGTLAWLGVNVPAPAL